MFRLIFNFLLISFILSGCRSEQSVENKKSLNIGLTIGKGKQARDLYEFNKIKNPSSNAVERHMRQRELAFKNAIPFPKDNISIEDVEWKIEGPHNIGGRSRALDIDVLDMNVAIAGGATGGLWRTETQGQDWQKVSIPDQNPAITCITQDTREGKTNVWYVGTGEGSGSSGTKSGAYYLGQGILKSIDNGLSWTALSSTVGSDVTTFDTSFDIVWSIETDASNDTLDVVYCAAYNRIYRSTNGGEDWTSVLQGTSGSPSYFADVEVLDNGVVYATMSSDGSKRGIWRSENGIDFVRIDPDGFPNSFGRIAIGASSSEFEILYFLAAETEGFGKETFNFRGDGEWNSLWKYKFNGGDGSSGIWTDLSQNFPSGPLAFDDFNAQGGYNLDVKISPIDTNLVLVAGTNLYRSFDGFATPNGVDHIGGYKEDTELPNFALYPNHHPDVHSILFLPQSPEQVFTTSDGGIHSTNIQDETIVWEDLNQGFRTAQYYHLDISNVAGDYRIVGGLQDNGTLYKRLNEETNWTFTFPYDGSYSAIPEGKDFILGSTQLGRIVKMDIDEQGNIEQFERIDPITADTSKYLFNNPFVIDPVFPQILYLLNGNRLFVCQNIDVFEFENTFTLKDEGWFMNNDTLENANQSFSAIHVVSEPFGTVFLGTNQGDLYKVENASSGPWVTRTDITGDNFPNGYIIDIATNPINSDEMAVLFSNYGIYSAFYSNNGGDTWSRIAGNLEENVSGTGDGPSFRTIAFVENDSDSYDLIVGTSIGLFYTDDYLAEEVSWQPIAENLIGNVIIEHIEYRPEDDWLVVATHGNGVYSAHLQELETGLNQIETKVISIHPNPADDYFSIIGIPEILEKGSVALYNISGQLCQEYEINEVSRYNLPNGTISGLYVVKLKTAGKIYATNLMVNN